MFQRIIADTAASRDLFDTKLMGILTPMPHEMIAKFQERYQESPEAATDWYFDISQKLNYVRAGRIAKDKKWKYASEYGMLDITINRSKPEKDPRDIAAARNQKAAAYPKCQLCPEIAGFAGNPNHPARQICVRFRCGLMDRIGNCGIRHMATIMNTALYSTMRTSRW
ncbi:MAG: hypothetical protein ACLSTI_03675 [Ruminococcus sp.]